MYALQNPRDRFLRKAAVLLLTLGILGSGLATVLHSLETDPLVLDAWLPPMNGLIQLGLLIYLLRKPESLVKVVWLAAISLTGAMCIPVWYSIGQALGNSGVYLTELLPPLSSLPVVLVAIMFLFVSANHVLWFSLTLWLLIGLPILTYLVLHPEELFSSRGFDLVIAFGPSMAIVSVLFSAFKGIEHRMLVLDDERSQMQILAERDPLTHLYNRRATTLFFSKISGRQDAQIGAIMFDLDHFKSINDRFGHSVGDMVLQEVSRRCQSILRQGDVMARWGGEEFLVIVQGVGDRALYGIAETLRKVISTEPIESVGKVTASFGVTLYGATESMDVLLHRVDKAMYSAKQQGRDRVISQ